MKLATSLLLAKFTCFSLAVNFSAVNLLHSEVVIYLSWSWSVILFSILLIFSIVSFFLTKLLTLGILFSTAVRAVLVAKLVILGISLLRIECSVSVCFCKSTIFPMFFSNAKWI